MNLNDNEIAIIQTNINIMTILMAITKVLLH